MPYLDAVPVPPLPLRAGSQAERMLSLYLRFGALTDFEVAFWMGLPEGRISARRNGLMERGLVRYHNEIDGPNGVTVCRWTLTVKGKHVARKVVDE